MKTNSQTPDNEVARLRQLLNRAIEIAEIVGWTRQTTYLEDMKQELHKMKEETEQMNQTLNINLGIALRRIFEIAEWLDSRAAVLEKSDRETLPKLRQELAALKARLAPAPEEPTIYFRKPTKQMTTQERINELKQCAAWETHVLGLEELALQLDSDLCRERKAHRSTREDLSAVVDVIYDLIRTFAPEKLTWKNLKNSNENT